MDRIIDYVSNRNGTGQRYENVHLRYSMLSDYFGAVHSAASSAASSAATASPPPTAPEDTTFNNNSNNSNNSINGGPWSVRGSGDFLPYSTLNCGGASSDPLPGPCSGNAGPQYNVSWPQVRQCYYDSVTTTVLLRQCYYDSVTTTVLLRQCYL